MQNSRFTHRAGERMIAPHSANHDAQRTPPRGIAMSMLSVCLITYNHETTVREALDSVLAQQISFPFEIVVGDDASTDATASILEDYAARHVGRLRLRLAATNAGVLSNFL